MRFLSFVFVLIFGLSVSAQSPTVTNLFSEGTKQANAGSFDEALKSYKTALFVAETEYLGASYLARLRYNIGVCYFRQDQFDLAANEFKHAILLKKEYTRAHYALGMTRLRKRNWKAAVTSLKDVVVLDPKNGEAWFDLAFASVAMNDFETAKNAFVHSIEFGSVDSALSHNNIGVILAMSGDLATAEKAFETAIALSGGGLPEAKRNLEFCRSKLARTPELIASDFQFARRNDSLTV